MVSLTNMDICPIYGLNLSLKCQLFQIYGIRKSGLTSSPSLLSGLTKPMHWNADLIQIKAHRGLPASHNCVLSSAVMTVSSSLKYCPHIPCFTKLQYSEHTFFCHDSAIFVQSGWHFDMIPQETIIYRLVMQNHVFDAFL